jgi:hypothetical protein
MTPLFGNKLDNVAIYFFFVGLAGCQLAGFPSLHIKQFPVMKHQRRLCIHYFIRMEQFGFGRL